MDLERIKQQFRIRSGRNKKRRPGRDTAQPLPVQSTSLESPTRSTKIGSSKQDQQSKPLPEAPQTKSEEPQALNGVATTKSEETEPQVDGDTTHAHGIIDAEEASDYRGPDQPTHADQPVTHIGPAESAEAQAEEEVGALQTQPEQEHTMASTGAETPSSEAADFDLAPPAPRPRPLSIEDICELLWSEGHLNFLLHNPSQLARFTAFLHKYRPDDHPLLEQYIETQKAIKAVEYANALACGLKPRNTGDGTPVETTERAAELDLTFKKVRDAAFDALVNAALPTYVTYNLVKVVSECLTNEITGRSTPVMNDMVGGLSEVFCLSDPNQEDNPIIYASEEFYRYTGYGQDEVIGHNCRFLQGRKTNPASPKRLKEAVQTGTEMYETLLNYKRNGKPFINLLMIAPLHDNNGKVKYNIGAQVDVSGLIEYGRAVDSFSRYLGKREMDQRQARAGQKHQGLDDEQRRKKTALARLKDLSEMFDLEESAIVQASSRSTSRTRDDDDLRSNASTERPRRTRRRLDEEASSDPEDDDVNQQKKDSADWQLGESGQGKLSGTLPGVYETFMLVRPAPSLRIVFVSPKLRRIGNIVQSPFLSHVAGPENTLKGLKESLSVGVPVSAKIHFTPERGADRDGTRLKSGTRHEDGPHGRAVWISCTPMLGADDRVGVWMIVFVQKSKIGSISRKEPQTQQINIQEEAGLQQSDHQRAERPTRIEIPRREHEQEDVPIKPVRIDGNTVLRGALNHESDPDDDHDADDEDGPEQDEENRVDDKFSEQPKDALKAVDGHADQDVQLHSEEGKFLNHDHPHEDFADEREILISHSPELPRSRDSSAERSDGFVTTRSPQRIDTSSDRIVIEDSDSASDHPHRPRSSTRSSSSSWSPIDKFPPTLPIVQNGEHSDHGSNAPTPRRKSHEIGFPGQTDHKPSSVASAEEDATLTPEGFSRNMDGLSPSRYNHSTAWEEIDSVDRDDHIDYQVSSNTAQMSSSMRMDYLRHPGSQRWGMPRTGQEEDKFSDLDCARSPYSVD